MLGPLIVVTYKDRIMQLTYMGNTYIKKEAIGVKPVLQLTYRRNIHTSIQDSETTASKRFTYRGVPYKR